MSRPALTLRATGPGDEHPVRGGRVAPRLVDRARALWESRAVRGLDGKVVVVTGGAGGIGSATCRRLAGEGACVVVADLDAEAAHGVAQRIVSDGGSALASPVDIRDESSVRALVDAAIERFGGVDALHANAADLSRPTLEADTDVVALDMAMFDHIMAVDLRGQVLCTRAAVPVMLERGGGAIVYTGSDAAFVGEKRRAAYAMAKAAIGALVRHVASRWGKEGIRANAVSPGTVITPEIAAAAGEGLSRLLGLARSRRLGEPGDVAAMVAHLVSDDGQWVNGQVISVNGGMLLR